METGKSLRPFNFTVCLACCLSPARRQGGCSLHPGSSTSQLIPQKREDVRMTAVKSLRKTHFTSLHSLHFTHFTITHTSLTSLLHSLHFTHSHHFTSLHTHVTRTPFPTIPDAVRWRTHTHTPTPSRLSTRRHTSPRRHHASRTLSSAVTPAPVPQRCVPSLMGSHRMSWCPPASTTRNWHG